MLFEFPWYDNIGEKNRIIPKAGTFSDGPEYSYGWYEKEGLSNSCTKISSTLMFLDMHVNATVPRVLAVLSISRRDTRIVNKVKVVPSRILYLSGTFGRCVAAQRVSSYIPSYWGTCESDTLIRSSVNTLLGRSLVKSGKDIACPECIGTNIHPRRDI